MNSLSTTKTTKVKNISFYLKIIKKSEGNFENRKKQSCWTLVKEQDGFLNSSFATQNRKIGSKL
jgi:hypothetical protein